MWIWRPGWALPALHPSAPRSIKAIYDSQDCSIIKHVTDPDVIAVSCTGEDMIPMIDDFAQIAGVDVKNRPWIDGDTDACAKDIAKAMDSRNAILIQGNGAIITGNSDGDMQALEIIMDKGCEAVIDTDIFNRPPLCAQGGVLLDAHRVFGQVFQRDQ